MQVAFNELDYMGFKIFTTLTISFVRSLTECVFTTTPTDIIPSRKLLRIEANSSAGWDLRKVYIVGPNNVSTLS